MPSSFSYVLKSAGFGLLLAAILLLIFPQLRNSERLPFAEQIDHYSSQLTTYSHAVRRTSPAVVNIYSQNYQRSNINSAPELTPTGLGSGVLMSEQGYILTNLHVIASADQVLVALQDGRLLTAQLIGGDPLTDLAVLQIESPNLPVIPQNDNYDPQVGDVVLAIGNPYNLGQTVTQGIISATGRTGMSSSGRQDFLQTDAAINRGNSGGALVNTRGDLVGINTSAFRINQNIDSYGISFSIPYPLAKRIMQGLIKDGRIIRGSIGVEGVPIDPVLARLAGLVERSGIRISKVSPGGPADKAGLKPMDLLIRFNGAEVKGVVDVMDKTAESRPGTEVTLTVLRNGESINIKVTTEEFKQDQ